MCFIKSLNKISFEIHQQCILTAEVSKGPEETLQPQLQRQVDIAPQNAVKHQCQFLHISVLKPFEGRQAPKFLFEWCHVQTKAANNWGVAWGYISLNASQVVLVGEERRRRQGLGGARRAQRLIKERLPWSGMPPSSLLAFPWLTNRQKYIDLRIIYIENQTLDFVFVNSAVISAVWTKGRVFFPSI